ncbi:MAG TPA: hypothetical protein VK188_19070 [Holophaga sp.]|nr:hypothetical protein [Holophaga sp.]
MEKLNSQELSFVRGGNFWSEISKVFGRQGKPFIGRDLIEIAVGAGTVVTAGALGATAPLAAALGKAAREGTVDYIDTQRGIHADRGSWHSRIWKQ